MGRVESTGMEKRVSIVLNHDLILKQGQLVGPKILGTIIELGIMYRSIEYLNHISQRL